jgi:pimeloyl-ACP methyl ester carboxylesterase
MTQAGAQILTRVLSRDGTEIAYFTSSEGPPLLLVHGGGGDHTRWDTLRPYLEPHFTVHAMDRRGRGASGDHSAYRIEREYEDVAAVIDAIAEDSCSPISVYGHSYGGFTAFGGATLTENISRLLLYEGWPPVNPSLFAIPPGFIERMEALLAEGRREEVIEIVFREVVKMSDGEIEAYRAQPSWQARVASAHTFPREERTFAATPFDARQAAQIAAPTLLLIGSESQEWGPEAETVAAALPDARIAVMDGQTHTADVVAPQLVAEQVIAFMGS